jgi:protein-disulfide isomerase
MAVAAKHVRADCIEVSEFPDLAQRYRVMAVPKVVINDRVEFEGALPEPEFLAAVLKAAAPNGLEP